MRSRNINFNFAGKVSCLLLLLFAFFVVNPVVDVVHAEEGVASGTGASAREATISSVSFSFGEPIGVTSLTPITSDGASAKYSVQATINIQNSGGYVVYLGSNKSELTGKNSGATINSVTSSTAYEGLPMNTWGYNAVEGEVAEDSFSTMPANVRGIVLGENTSTNIQSESRTFTLSFAAHVGNDKPADTYENEVTMSVVSAPLEIANVFGIETMQEMTPMVCSAASVGDTAQLKDVRDGKYYWVAKLADDNCWMTQNLDLDLSTSVALMPEDSDVMSSWTPGFTTVTRVTTGTINSGSQIETRSWSLGDYRIKDPTISNSCGSGKNDLSQCATQFTAYATPITANNDELAHYIVGNHYQWNAATAGTGGTITSGQAASSICPKGWKLPESNAITAGSFGGLVNAYNIGTDVAKLTSSPLYFVRGGVAYQTAVTLFDVAGNYGVYWSSTPTSMTGPAYDLSFGVTDNLVPSSSSNRYDGNSVRCVARTDDGPVATPVVYSVTYKHASSTGTLPNVQEVESTADSYTFTAPEKPSDLLDTCSHAFTGWSPSTAPHYNNSPEYPVGSSITLTRDNPSIVLYPKFQTGNWC